MYIDHSVYPDVDDPPEALKTLEEKADYVQRICAAWDFHIHPEPQTFELFSGWKEVFDRFPYHTSPAYHAFRQWFKWESCSLANNPLPIKPYYLHLDQLEERLSDPCENLI